MHYGLVASPPTVCVTGQGTSPLFISQPADTVAAGSVTLPCSVTGTPHPSVQWFKDNSLLSLDVRISQAVSGDLTITSLTPQDNGLYHCLAMNTAGSVKSRTARLELACK